MSFQYVYCGGWCNFRGEAPGFKDEVRGLRVLRWSRETGELVDHGLFAEQLLGQSMIMSNKVQVNFEPPCKRPANYPRQGGAVENCVANTTDYLDDTP